GRLWNAFAALQIEDGTELPAHVEALLAKRERGIREAEAAVEESRRLVVSLEKERVPLAEKAESDGDSLAAMENRLGEAFEADAEAASLRVKAVALGEAVESLQAKLQRAREEFLAKSPAYLQDEMFAYLKARRWGEPGYAGWGLARRLDGWLAGLISYRRKDADLKRLADIPAWIEGRLEKATAERDGLLGRLEAMREAAL